MPVFRRIYIVGFMGSGKTTTGKHLAAALHWSFIDLDSEIELITGKTINEIFSDSGEEFFREVESKTLRNLDIQRDTVISVGGGAPCFFNNMDFMNQSGIVIYLRMTPQQLISRLSGESGERPLIKDIAKNKLLTYISDKLSQREEYYNRALLITDSMDLNISDLLDKIQTELQN